MKTQNLKYELGIEVVNYILESLNRTQIAGVENAQKLIAVVEILKNPANREELEKEQYENLKTKFEKK